MAMIPPTGTDVPVTQKAEMHSTVAEVKDGLESIRKDHDNLRALLKKCKELRGSSDHEAKLRAANQMVTCISQHASAEERTLYPAIKAHLKNEEDGAKLLYDMMVMDDQINKEHLKFIESHHPTSAAEWELWDRQLAKFIMVEEEHLNKEEETTIASLDKVLTPEQKAKLYDDWDAALKSAPMHPYPTIGGTTALPAKLMHPVAGAVDKAVHAVTETFQKVFPSTLSPQHKAEVEGHAAGTHPAGAA